MLLYYITDGRQLRGDLLAAIDRALRAGVDWIQIREKDLSAQELFELTSDVMKMTCDGPSKVFVNTRADVALAAGAHGVHLPAGSVPAAEIRKLSPPGFVVGVSCHDTGEVRRAASEGADFVVFGPVFETPSKQTYGPPKGLKRLEEACGAAPIPVLALGGVGLSNAAECLAAGAAGIAGISLFQQAEDLVGVAAALRKLPSHPAKE
jgi:thiamine-phosphate pyrophosphorylase